MKNHSSSRAGKGKTAYRTPHSFIADRPEYLKNKNSHQLGRLKTRENKFNQRPGSFTQ